MIFAMLYMVIEMRNIDIIFNSQKDVNGKSFQIASGHISETTLLFENENIIAVISANGSAEFYYTDNSLLAKGEVPKNDGGREVYEEVSCQVVENEIILKFPIYEWIDNYPNCDGEHDRWDTRKIGENILKFDYIENKVK